MSAKTQQRLVSETQERRSSQTGENEFSAKNLLSSETTLLDGESCKIGTSERSEKQCPCSPYCANADPSIISY